MPAPIDLPDGYTQRPLALSDATAVFVLMAAVERAALGEVMIEEADIVADWQRPSYDVGASSVGVLDATRTVVAYAERIAPTRADAAVHPDHLGRGLGTALARWLQAKAAEEGDEVIGMPVPQGSTGDRLLESLGWFVRWTSWGLELPEGATVPERPLPPAYAIRAATPDDYAACWQVVEDAFLEWSERERTPLEDWLAENVHRPGFEPWHLRVVTDPSGEIVAAAVLQIAGEGTETFISRLATREDQRGRGLGQALLVDAFRVGREHGATRSSLSTDSRTGALGLYLKVGMVVTSTWLHRATTVAGAADGSVN